MTQQYIPAWMHPSHQSLGRSGLPLATWSPCTRYRYTLRRVWRSVDEPRVVTWILLNPSTADEFMNDATIRRCIGFSRAWGFDELMIVNGYAWRSTDPRGLRSRECLAAGGPVGEGNDAAITAACARAEQVVCGWGRHLQPDRRAALARLLGGVKLTALATNDDGSPSHPLRLPGSLKPHPFTLTETA